jgi:hypothetical protein
MFEGVVGDLASVRTDAIAAYLAGLRITLFDQLAGLALVGAGVHRVALAGVDARIASQAALTGHADVVGQEAVDRLALAGCVDGALAGATGLAGVAGRLVALGDDLVVAIDGRVVARAVDPPAVVARTGDRERGD